jgi:hypothetical protein
MSLEGSEINLEKLVGDGSLLNYLASLLVYPDNTVKVNLLIITIV